MGGALQGVIRLLHALCHSARGWWIIRTRFARMGSNERAEHVERWALRMLSILGIELRVQGQRPTEGPLLIVSNHVSWLDIVTLHAARYTRFVSKSEVRGWPLIGTLSDGAGTLYVKRDRRSDAMRVVHHMSEALQRGEIVAVFPEGTTGDGRTLLPFHANLLQAAITAQAPVMPVALRFVDAATGVLSDAPRYLLEDRLLVSLWRTACAPPLLARVHYGLAQAPQGRSRREWSQALEEQVRILCEATQTESSAI